MLVLRKEPYPRHFVQWHSIMVRGHPTVCSGNICSEDLNRLRCSDLIAVKTRDFVGETLTQTFVTRGLINFYCFRRDKYVV